LQRLPVQLKSKETAQQSVKIICLFSISRQDKDKNLAECIPASVDFKKMVSNQIDSHQLALNPLHSTRSHQLT